MCRYWLLTKNKELQKVETTEWIRSIYQNNIRSKQVVLKRSQKTRMETKQMRSKCDERTAESTIFMENHGLVLITKNILPFSNITKKLRSTTRLPCRQLSWKLIFCYSPGSHKSKPSLVFIISCHCWLLSLFCFLSVYIQIQDYTTQWNYTFLFY